MTAEELHNRGREAGHRGEYQEAIRLFEMAHEADPEWPYPIYDMAYTYLLIQDYDQALHYYRRCNEVAPNGYYTSKTALWALEKEMNEDYPKGLYLAFIQLEWKGEEERRQILQNIIQQYPDYAPAYKSLQSLIENPETRMELIEKGLTLEADDETYSMLLINKALLISFYDKMLEATEMLKNYMHSGRRTLMGYKISESILEQWTNSEQ